jgi:hypothetical protein
MENERDSDAVIGKIVPRGDHFELDHAVKFDVAKNPLNMIFAPEKRGISRAQVEAAREGSKLPESYLYELTHVLANDCRYAGLERQLRGEEPIVIIKKREDVRDFIELTGIFVPRQGQSKDRYVFLLAVAHWREPPGLALLLKNREFFELMRHEEPFPGPAWDAAYINE